VVYPGRMDSPGRDEKDIEVENGFLAFGLVTIHTPR